MTFAEYSQEWHAIEALRRLVGERCGGRIVLYPKGTLGLEVDGKVVRLLRCSKNPKKDVVRMFHFWAKSAAHA